MRLSLLAGEIGATLVGEDREVKGLNALHLAREDELSFVDSGRHLAQAQASRAGALIVPPSLRDRLPGRTLLVVPEVRVAVARVAWRFYEQRRPRAGISPLAFVADGASVHPEASVMPFVYVGEGAKVGPRAVLYPGVFVGEECEVGEDCVLHPNVVLYPRTRLGRGVIVHAGTVLGSDGFGYAQDRGAHLKIPHFGRVEVEDEVEIGANAAVDRATFGTTRLGAGSKIDNLVQIAHNVELGRGCVLAGQSGLTGSVRLGDGVMVGGQAGINAPVGAGALVAARAGVAGEVPPGAAVAGAPAFDIRRWRRCVAVYQRLPELLREVRELRERLARLEEVLHERDSS